MKQSIFTTVISIIILTGCVNYDISRLYPEPNNFKKEIEERQPKYQYTYIDNFKRSTNDELRQFIKKYKDYKGRKIAVFDGDGTLFKQVPYYVADEAIYSYATTHPNWKKALLDKMIKTSTTSKEYLKYRLQYLSGLDINTAENLGYSSFDKFYSFYTEMYSLVYTLKQNGFEIWVITASPQVLYEKFISEYLEIPREQVIGIRTVIKGHLISDEIIPPIPDGMGKRYAIDTFIQGTPLFAAGNSISDVEMIQSSDGIRFIVNPNDSDEVKELNNQTLWEYAGNNHWIIQKCQDTPRMDYETMACYKFGIKKNSEVK